jgi:ArsR family transcriptional regulator, arsenate/arsenite/antimonite-responsive transcriptional repressor
MARPAKQADLARFFVLLSDPLRLRLLNLMRGGEVCVCLFVAILRQKQPKISRHLAWLRKSGIVAARRDGRWMYYSIVPPKDKTAAAILSTTLASLQSDPKMQAEFMRLHGGRCQPEPLPRTIRRGRSTPLK